MDEEEEEEEEKTKRGPPMRNHKRRAWDQRKIPSNSMTQLPYRF